MKKIIQNVQAAIQSAINEQPEQYRYLPKYIDEDWGQLDEYGSHPPVKYPCVLIDITNTTFSDIGRNRKKTPENRQEATADIIISVANLKLTNTSSKAPESQKENSLTIWKTVEFCHSVLHGFRPAENTGNLIRTQLKRVHRDDGVQLYEISYSLAIHDC